MFLCEVLISVAFGQEIAVAIITWEQCCQTFLFFLACFVIKSWFELKLLNFFLHPRQYISFRFLLLETLFDGTDVQIFDNEV